MSNSPRWYNPYASHDNTPVTYNAPTHKPRKEKRLYAIIAGVILWSALIIGLTDGISSMTDTIQPGPVASAIVPTLPMPSPPQPDTSTQKPSVPATSPSTPSVPAHVAQQPKQQAPAPASNSAPAAPAAPTLKLISFTSDVNAGAYATITVQTTPGATGDILVEYKSGPSKSEDLVTQTADSTGRITWHWKVGTRTTPGDWPVTVTVNGQSITETLHVT